MKASGTLTEPLTEKLLVELFEKRVDSINWEQAKKDVFGFLKDQNQVNLWSAKFFKGVIQSVKLD